MNNGWFADIDPDSAKPWLWQPVLQVPGMVHPISVWFETAGECESYIEEVLIRCADRWSNV